MTAPLFPHQTLVAFLILALATMGAIYWSDEYPLNLVVLLSFLSWAISAPCALVRKLFGISEWVVTWENGAPRADSPHWKLEEKWRKK